MSPLVAATPPFTVMPPPLPAPAKTRKFCPLPALELPNVIEPSPAVEDVVRLTLPDVFAVTVPAVAPLNGTAIGLSEMLPLVELSVKELVGSVPLPNVTTSPEFCVEMLPEPLVVRLMLPLPLVPVAVILPPIEMKPLPAVVASVMLCALMRPVVVMELALLNEKGSGVEIGPIVIGPVPMFVMNMPPVTVVALNALASINMLLAGVDVPMPAFALRLTEFAVRTPTPVLRVIAAPVRLLAVSVMLLIVPEAAATLPCISIVPGAVLAVCPSEVNVKLLPPPALELPRITLVLSVTSTLTLPAVLTFSVDVPALRSILLLLLAVLMRISPVPELSETELPAVPLAMMFFPEPSEMVPLPAAARVTLFVLLDPMFTLPVRDPDEPPAVRLIT